MLPTTTNNPQSNPQTQDPLKQCMDMLDQFIKAGGATADDLSNLKMDLQDAQSAMNGEDQAEPQGAPQGPQDNGIAGMISKMKGA